ncbi:MULTISPECIES: GNAT family N-acetyltransferase [unclassified Aurantimonas]|uniref:GNAT family N-acetyltransferase n=1 Tax=unclassified Aurantimonas TaxID=2638230 RepID=UPI002E19FAFF|nr:MULTISPECIES: GNAT family N-acetyltransferase [unclassified Aurantimonas]MEC5291768.1 GNAT family N-acetyltransferase [Aurantimonas sp. C2-3-R2]MEC5412853.1 GNAT family N-acetyltransferase [Aurantimonas sp. C2-4-R8]
MAAKPLVDELFVPPLAAPEIALAGGAELVHDPERDIAVSRGDTIRHFSIYAPMAAFGLVEELSHLSRRAIEPNVFFDPQFLVPAMPRLDERKVRLMVVRDEAGSRSRLRLLMPFSLERSASVGGPATIRAWTHPFGPLGTLPVDGDDPVDTLASFLETIARPEFALPDVLVLPDVRIDGAMATTLLAVAKERGLPATCVNGFTRAALLKDADGEPHNLSALSGRRRRELARQRRLLEATGQVSFDVARTKADVQLALEDFFVLEASGWKGRQRSALITDRYRAAFAREAVNALAADGRVRVFTLKVGTRTVASLVAFVDRGEAYTWKSAYDEAFAAASPGQQIVAEATRALLADPAVKRADSCAMPDHFVMNRFWSDRIEIATIVLGLNPNGARRVEAAAKGLSSMRRSRNFARLMRERLRAMLSFS